MTRFLAVLAFALASLVALPACGGEDPTPDADEEGRVDYEQEVRAAEDVVEDVGERLSLETSPDAFPDAVATTRDELRAGAERISAASPPDDAAEIHPRLVEAMEAAADAAEELAERAAANDELPPQAQLEELTSALEAVDVELRELEALGYDIGRRT